MPIDQVPAHLLAGVNGRNSVIAGALFCYGVGNDVPGRAQNRIGGALLTLAHTRAREGRARNPGRALGRGVADLFLANLFCSARRRRWPRRCEIRGQLRRQPARNRRHGLRACSRSAFSPLRRADRDRIATALNLHVKRGRLAHACSYARARGARANPGRALGRGVADLFLANLFCSARRRRWPRRCEIRGQLRRQPARNRRHGLRACSRSAFSPLRRADRDRIATALNLHVKRGRLAHACSYARARARGARIRAALWAAASPIYFWRICFARLAGGGGRGVVRYGVSFADSRLATDDMGFGRARAPLFRPCAGPIATASRPH